MFRTTGSPFFTTQRNKQPIVAELFFNPNGTKTFSDKLMKTILALQGTAFQFDKQLYLTYNILNKGAGR
ncbi:MAG: transposon-encoded TnpW family protein [Blautia sp.]|nr:transposon-encoded TnpW family protein [Blautia sp.]